MNLANIYTRGKKVYLFIRKDNGELEIKEDNSFHPYWYEYEPDGYYKGYDGTPLVKKFVTNPNDIKAYRTDGSWEADLPYRVRYMIDKIPKITKAPLRYCFLDIENLTTELPRPVEDKKCDAPISCITFYDNYTEKYTQYYLGDFKNEKELMKQVIWYFKNNKFDLILGWNISGYDYPVLYYRHNKLSKEISPIGQSRWGDNELYYPAGMSVVDYLGLVKKLFKKGIKSYKLDDFMQQHLGYGKEHKKVDFSKLDPVIKKRNMEDVKLMVEFEKKYQIIPYYDSIRRLSKCIWEDLPFKTIWKNGKRLNFSNNSKVIEMLLFQEAKEKGKILPSKYNNTFEHEEYQGAYREAFEIGLHQEVTACDLTSAYPTMISDFCLSPENIVEAPNENTITIDGVHFEQNKGALLPSMVDKLLKRKAELKKEVNKATGEYAENLQHIYDATKAMVNTSYGSMALPFFRLYSHEVASATTYLVRDLLKYVIDKINANENTKVIYCDTDSVYYKTNLDIYEKLNGYIQEWAKQYNIKSSIEFDFEGIFESIFIIGLCHYKGRFKKKGKGEIIDQERGIETLRADSSEFLAYFQAELLNKILNGESKESVLKWVNSEKERMKTLPLKEIAFPCKLNRAIENYKNLPIFARALEYTQEKVGKKEFNKHVGDLFYYLYVKSDEYEETTRLKINRFLDDKRISEKKIKKTFTEEEVAKLIESERLVITEEHVPTKGKNKDVLAFDEYTAELYVDRNIVDWKKMIDRNINNKLDTIIEAMNYQEGDQNAK